MDSLEHKPTPWGLWSTGALFCIILGSHIAVAHIAKYVLIIVGLQNPQSGINVFVHTLPIDGFFLSVVTFARVPVVVGLCVLFAGIRRDINISDYLGLRLVNWKAVLQWSFFAFALALASDILTNTLGRSIVPYFMIKIYSTARFVPLLWLTLIVAAPVYEEVLFRGFLFKGLQNSRLGSLGAVIITALAWAAIHPQYNFYGISYIFLLGVLLGWARAKTNSIYTTLAMHALNNTIATVQVALYLKYT